MMTKKLLLIAAAIAVLCVSQPAEAGHGAWGGFAPWYTGYTREHIPYYALHPPVYYSYPVPRTYGYSPFAYPPGVMMPEVEMQPQVIENPYVAPSLDEGPEAIQPQVEPSNLGLFDWIRQRLTHFRPHELWLDRHSIVRVGLLPRRLVGPVVLWVGRRHEREPVV